MPHPAAIEPATASHVEAVTLDQEVISRAAGRGAYFVADRPGDVEPDVACPAPAGGVLDAGAARRLDMAAGKYGRPKSSLAAATASQDEASSEKK